MSKQKPFERDEQLEQLLRERAENPTRYQASHSYNEKRRAEQYAAEKSKRESKR